MAVQWSYFLYPLIYYQKYLYLQYFDLYVKVNLGYVAFKKIGLLYFLEAARILSRKVFAAIFKKFLRPIYL